ncbi:glycosyltransferase family 39 protein [uncultured Draconibacterium sp.]|uniref:ArnT family glycosyltransferase n=1 Tax=uncultured Draconibacterium sp. TaxID=1573823 RepID=UPI0032173170
MNIKPLNSRYLPILLFLFALLVYVSYSWGVSIYILDEAKNATCAREMFESNDFFVPTFNNVLRTDKPPLHYFFMMLSYAIFGVNPFAARFFSAVFGALTILITYLFTKKFLDKRAALFTTLVLLASIHLSLQFHLAVPDPYLIFFFTATLFLFYLALKTNKLSHVILMYAAIGLGTLSKGPVAILLPGLIFLLYLIFSKQFKWKIIASLKPFLGVLIVLAIAVPWYLVNGLHTNWEWTRGFFLKHNVNRFSGAMEGHGGIFLITFLYVFAGLFPFALFFPQVFKEAYKNKSNNFILFNLIAGLTVVVFFSVSQTKLINYTVPSYPFIAVLTGYYFAFKLQTFRQIRTNYFFLLFLGILIPIGGFIGLKYDPSLAPVNTQALWFAVLPLGLICAYFFRKEIVKFILLIGATTLLTACVFFAIVFPVFDQQNPVVQSLPLLKGKEVVYFEKFNPSYSFYLKKKIEKIEANQMDDFFNSNPEGVIISTKKRYEKAVLAGDYTILYSGKDLFESPTSILIGAK